MLKQEARNIYREKRKALTAELRQNYDIQLCEKYLAEFYAFQTVHLFLPITKNNEPDTILIANRLSVSGKHVISTSIIHGEHLLKHVIIQPPFSYPLNQWGIPVPPEEPVIDIKAIDLVLVPLLAYDEQGYRVGYGKGYYDRFLSLCKKSCLRVGLSYFPPEHCIDDADEYDIPLTHCITPSKIWKFGL